MARVKGGYLGGTYDIPKKQPLDSRMLVTKRVDLINPSVWKTNGSPTGEVGHYNGMIVAVNSDGVYNGIYYLTDRNAITDENYTAYKDALAVGADVEHHFAMWTKLGTLDDLETVEKKIEELIGEIPEGKTIIDMIAEVKPSVNLVPVDGTITIADADNGNKTIGVSIAPVANNTLVAVDGGLFVPATVMPEYSIEKQEEANDGFAATYKLKKTVGEEVSYIGDAINIPSQGLSDAYSSGNGIEIADNKISVKLADATRGLVAVDGALTINLATKDSDGAMSKEDKAFLDALKELNISTDYVTKTDLQEIRESIAQIEQGYSWSDM